MNLNYIQRSLMPTLRQEVLKLYKQILRTGKSWISASSKPEETEKQRQYIITEAKELFQRNKHIHDEQQIRQHIMEAQARLEMALHYKNPYPRPVNLPPMAIVQKSKKWKIQEKIRKESRPIYIKSLDSDK